MNLIFPELALLRIHPPRNPLIPSMSSPLFHKFSSPSSSPKISVPSSLSPLFLEGDRLPSQSPAMSAPSLQLPPGFRFHPTDEELILHYLRNRAAASPCPVSIISEVDIYKFDPWDLPGKAAFGDREWYFFSPRDRKYPNGIRPNRAAASGYWKATGTDKPICSGNENIGVKKALVFYKGRPPKGLKTNWIMHEYRLSDSHTSNTYKPIRLRDHSMRLDDWVLCRIYMKSSHHSPAMIDELPEEPYHRTPSMPEFFEDYSPLSNIFTNQPELPRFDGGSPLISHQLLHQSLINQGREGPGNGFLLPPLSQAESLVSASSKRRRMTDCNTEESSATFQSLKKQNEITVFPNFSGQFDLSQPFLFSQQLLLNSQLGNLQ